MTLEFELGQKNFKEEIFWICITASELWIFEIFNWASKVKFDVGGQKSSQQKFAYLTKGLCIKEIVLISFIVSELWTFEIFNMALEVKFDLGGQRSLEKKLHI